MQLQNAQARNQQHLANASGCDFDPESKRPDKATISSESSYGKRQFRQVDWYSLKYHVSVLFRVGVAPEFARNRMKTQTIIVVAIAAIFFTVGCARESGSPFSQPKLDLKKLSPFAESPSVPSSIGPPPQVDPVAPEQFLVRFHTTKGDFVAQVFREWSPRGVDRFHNMVKIGYFEDTAIFRAVSNFMFQFGLHGNPAVNEEWAEARFQDDPPVGVSNLPGTLCFAKAGQANSRSVQMFVNLGQNVPLDGQGFTPFGKVIEGMDVVRAINTEYGENPASEDVQGKLKRKGNAYILKRFPRVDLIRSVELIQPNG